MQNIITEITPLGEYDSFYLVDRTKQGFDYPVHCHPEVEINFLTSCQGAKRIVGDSVETCSLYDLVIVGSGLEHTWEQGNCPIGGGGEIREVTIQFMPDVLPREVLMRKPFMKIRELMERADKGVAFGTGAILQLAPIIESMTAEIKPLEHVLQLLRLLNAMGESDDYHLLATPGYTQKEPQDESRRVWKVKQYITTHYNQEIRLDDMADMVSMTPSAFSRFFRLRTGQSLSDYIIDVRIGTASRLLLKTIMPVIEICYSCGFNNISNFNRIFKRKKGCSPTEFREYYKKNIVKV